MYNGILIIDKPQDFTSHDVVAKLRGILKMRQIGHTGTLDPMATGVLVVLLGKATGASDYLMAQTKEYVARFRLGLSTDTQDITGGVTQKRDVTASKADVEGAVKAFKGQYDQLPPMYSAIQIGGRRLYDMARNGEEVARKTRSIVIEEIALLADLGHDEYEVRIVCSKGTYIRTLCHDIGEKLGCGATMTALRRVKSGDFTVAEAYSLEQVQQCENKQDLLLPTQSAFAEYPQVVLTLPGQQRALNGAFLGQQHLTQGEIPLENTLVRVLGTENQFLQLGVGGLLDTGKPCIFCKKSFVMNEQE